MEDYWSALADVLPDFPPAQQHLAVVLYRELARGAPLTAQSAHDWSDRGQAMTRRGSARC